MNLKKLEAYGFKSFADKLALDFNSGVTCIVGPNGCGKSNVSDAIRWVLGEQSPKNLRGKNMQEVIFNGTTNRKPLGYCEVSLFFDNTKRVYDINCDELVIKRKLYRSGESEYYINNETARLKDILDLFRDTGIGKDGYSVVGQGKIDSFLSAKPEDRRQIFEEAAGISKYKAKRIESQRKLDRTNDNLLRIRDKLDVYETRMEPLEKQSKEAMHARELKERLKVSEVNHFLYLCEHNEDERKALSTHLELLTKRLKDATNEGARLEQAYADNRETRQNMDNEYKVLTDEKLDISIRLSNKTGQNNLKKQKLETIRGDIARLEAEIKEKNAAVGDHTASRESNKTEHEKTIVDLVDAKRQEETVNTLFSETEREVERQRKEIDVTNEMLLSSADAWGEINGDLSKLKTEISMLEKSVADNGMFLEERKAELKDINKKLAEISGNIDAINADRAEKKSIKNDIDVQYGEKLSALEEGQDRYTELRDTVAKLNSRIEYLEANKANFLGYDAAVRFLMGQKDERIRDKVLGVVGNLINVPSQFATAIEVALGGSVNNIVTADQNDTSFLIDFLNKFRGGRGTFLPLSVMRPRSLEDQYMDALDEPGCYGIAVDLVKFDRKFRSAIETLLGRVVVVDTKETAIKMTSRYRSAFRIVTLDGAHYAANGAVSGGRKEGADSRLLSTEADIAETKRQLANHSKLLEVLVQDTDEQKKGLKEMETTSRVLDGIMAKLDKELSVMEQRREYLEQDYRRVSTDISRLTNLVSDDKKEIALKNSLFSIENAKIDSTSSNRVNANDLLGQLAQELKDREQTRNKVNSERTEIMLRAKQLENKLTEIEKNIVISGKTIERLNSEMLDAGVQLKVLGSEEQKLGAELEKLALEMNGNEEITAIQAKIDGLDGKKVELALRQEELRRAEHKNSELLSSLNADRAKSEANLERIEGEMKSVSERVLEEYGLDYERALEFKDYDFDDDKGVQEGKVLRRELAKLGDINEKAVEDLQELNTEYSELKVHYDDITAAKSSLEDTIKDLTVKMETNFSESFAKIKVNFAEVFTELFDGGRGMLDLDMEHGMSVLDAGIIIAAEPPGKRLQNIDLLSGGERAMTAIALIFAIIKLHPMPFCVLDEVDAPLDDANADIYAKYLKRFSTGTQFIIVSHRKPTMELADELYGITMQEKGVSKYFTVKLNDALKMVK